MGVDFEVKPTPINIAKVKEDKKNMLMDWYKEKYPSLHDKVDKINESTDPDSSLDDLDWDDITNLDSWRLDVDFRSKYCKFMADSCMSFAKAIPDDVWRSDSLEHGTIQEAWDFFTNRLQVPNNGAL